MEVNIGGKIFPVEITYKRMKSLIIMRLKEDGTIQISCRPRTSEAFIRSFIEEKESWILKTQTHQKQHESLHREGVNGPIIYWLGEKKYVNYVDASQNKLFVDGDILTFYLKDHDDATIEKTFRKYANQTLMNLINEYRWQWDEKICEQNYLPIPDIQMRYMTSRWGVCNRQKCKITMSTRLIHYPSICLEAILLHEYAHFLVPNHSKKFYQVIERYMLDYRKIEKLLK